MLSRSCFNLLNLDDCSVTDRAQIPKLMNVPGIITYFGGGGEGEEEKGEVSPGVKNGSRRIIVANQLPVKDFYKDEKEGKKWCFEWDRYALDTLILQLKDGLSPDLEIVYVGCLKADVELNDQEEVANVLWEKFSPRNLALQRRLGTFIIFMIVLHHDNEAAGLEFQFLYFSGVFDCFCGRK